MAAGQNLSEKIYHDRGVEMDTIKKKKIIIDTDCGSDDAMAIFFVKKKPAYEFPLRLGGA